MARSPSAQRRPPRAVTGAVGASSAPRGPDDLDDLGRARIRRRVLSRTRPSGPGAADRAFVVLALLAAPAPHLVRILASVALVGAVVASATVASADALPHDPLYGVKLVTEELRLSLAGTPQDRAAVELSMAEHRLAEAERLALEGHHPAALVATSMYGAHLANAAAALAEVERQGPKARLVAVQLQLRLAQHQRRAAGVAGRLAADPQADAVAPVFETIASHPPSTAGLTVSEVIAEHAAVVTERLAKVAERLANAAERRARQQGPRAGSGGPDKGSPVPADDAGDEDEGEGWDDRDEDEVKGKHPDPGSAREAAEKAKREAEKARKAADKAEEAAKGAPKPEGSDVPAQKVERGKDGPPSRLGR